MMKTHFPRTSRGFTLIELLVVIAIIAILASILPGRRAANATPTEALAVD